MIRVLELFGGIGACTKAIKNIGADHEIVDYVEIDASATKSFNAINNTNFKPQDIREWDKDVAVDLIMHGSPCQDFSVAGKNRGGDKGSGTRSSLMYETLRIVEKTKPKVVIWENVKNLLSKKHRHNFDSYLVSMSKLGYSNTFFVFNAKDFGIPQNRERVFTISVLNGSENVEMNLSDHQEKRLKDILIDDTDEKFFLTEKQMERVPDDIFDIALAKSYDSSKPIRLGGLYDRPGNRHQAGSIFSVTGVCATLSTMQGGNQEPIIVDTDKGIVRRLSPNECWRLMGFDDEDFRKASEFSSDSQLYKQAGNSIVVNVLEEIIRNLFSQSLL